MKKIAIILVMFLGLSIGSGLHAYSTSLAYSSVTLSASVINHVKNIVTDSNYTSVLNVMDYILKGIDKLNTINNEIKYDCIPVECDVIFKTVFAPANWFLSV